MPNKFTAKEVVAVFHENGCELLEPYVNSQVPVRFRCKCGNDKSKVQFTRFKRGTRCAFCCSRKKYTFEEVQTYFHMNDCILLSKAYRNCTQKLRYICNCGQVARIAFYVFKQGHRCMKCSGKEKTSIEELRLLFQKNGCVLLSKRYQYKAPLRFLCSCGREGAKTMNDFKKRPRCNACRKSRKGCNSVRWNSNREEVALTEKMRRRCCNLLSNTLTALGIRKRTSSQQLLGYSVKELKNHLTSYLHWPAIKHDWHLDHIFPISAFVKHGITDLRVINSLDNLQPLSAKDNLKKRDRYNVKEFVRYLKKKGCVICKKS